MIHVLGVVPYALERTPGQRFRMEQWAQRLRADAIDVKFQPFLDDAGMDILYTRGSLWQKGGIVAKGYLRRMALLLGSGSFDAAYVYREAALLGPAWIEAALAARMPLVFDFDDAIYLPTPTGGHPAARWLRPLAKTGEICRRATEIIVGNEVLADFARKHARNVTVVPTTIELDAYTCRPRQPNPRPVVGWSGSTTTLPYLLELLPALVRLRQRIAFDLRIIGAAPGSVETAGLSITCVPWSAATEVEDLRSIDVGLMPLPDDPWTRGKCGLKALQYMALAIPPVVSPVGVNSEIVCDDSNGFLADGEDQWVAKIETLLRHPGLRQRLGFEARRTVERAFSAAVQVPRVAEVLSKAASSRR